MRRESRLCLDGCDGRLTRWIEVVFSIGALISFSTESVHDSQVDFGRACDGLRNLFRRRATGPAGRKAFARRLSSGNSFSRTALNVTTKSLGKPIWLSTNFWNLISNGMRKSGKELFVSLQRGRCPPGKTCNRPNATLMRPSRGWNRRSTLTLPNLRILDAPKLFDGSTARNIRTPSAICWDSKWTLRRFCRRMSPATALTMSRSLISHQLC